jgi:E3 ubiquitin-protein ligase BRE1
VILNRFGLLTKEVSTVVTVGMHTPDSSLQGNEQLPPALLFESIDKFHAYLGSRAEEIKSVLSNLLRSRSPREPQVQELEDKLRAVLARQEVLVREIDQYAKENTKLEEQINTATRRYLLAEKKYDRAKSAVVQKMEQKAIQSSDASSATNHASAEGTAEVNGTVPLNEELISERDMAMATSEKRKEQIELLEAEKVKLSNELTETKARLHALGDDDYAKTELFKAMKVQHEEIVNRINDLTAKNVELREEAQKLQAERTAFRAKLEEEQRALSMENGEQNAVLERDLVRIRNQRDEQMAAIKMLQAGQPQHDLQHLRQLYSANEDRIKALEQEVERLKAKIDDEDAGNLAEADMSPESMREKIASLEKQLAILNKELPLMESAYSKANATANKKIEELIEHENIVAMLKGDKEKATQKFFNACKTIETQKLEIRALRAQNSKSAEIITQLKEAQNASRLYAQNADKQLAEVQANIGAVTIQLQEAQEHGNKHAHLTARMNASIGDMKALAIQKDTQCAAAEKAQRQADVKVEELQAKLDEANRQNKILKAKADGNMSEVDKNMRVSSLRTKVNKRHGG